MNASKWIKRGLNELSDEQLETALLRCTGRTIGGVCGYVPPDVMTFVERRKIVHEIAQALTEE